MVNENIDISSKKTKLTPSISSAPNFGTITYKCEGGFFTPNQGNLSYENGTISGEEIYAEANPNVGPRTGYFYLSATTANHPDYEETKTITCAWTVTQAGAGPGPEPTLEFSAVTSTIPASGTLIQYQIKSSEPTTVFYGDKFVTYSTSPVEYTVSGFTVSENTATTSVSHTMTARTNASAHMKTATVTQDAAGEENLLTFVILSGGVINWRRTTDSATPRDISYKIVGKSDWTPITSTTTGTQINVAEGDIVRFKGNNLEYGESSYVYNTFSGTTCRFNVKGNIMSLISGQSYESLDRFVNGTDFVFYGLFKDCTGLTDASELDLPVKVLVNHCYGAMFAGCTLLTTAPALNATTLAVNCYNGMFQRCTNLTTAPDLPATTLAEGCYQYMFDGCTSLTGAPALNATTLVYACYHSMFDGCTSLTTAPALTAETLARSCYEYMFAGCTSLEEAPDLPAEILAVSCYENMFYNCTSLTGAPELPATELADSCYYGMFNGCTSLTSASTLPADIMEVNCYNGMFNGCTSLEKAPDLPAETLAESCYRNMFYVCTSLTGAPALTATTLARSCYEGMFVGCTSLEEAPDLPAETLADYCYKEMFSGCTSLTSAPALSATTLANSCYYFMFGDCTSLEEAPDLPADRLEIYCYYGMFANCTSLTGAPALSATTLAANCYGDMFAWCTSLEEAPDLPAETLVDSCYYGMFSGCTKLEEAPELPATKLEKYCYGHMFAWCPNLRYIKCLATDISGISGGSGCTENWVYRTGGNGEFVTPIPNDWSGLTRGYDTVPEDWEIVSTPTDS